MMATPFYEEEMSAPSPSSCMYDKKNLKLDFSSIKREKGPDSATAVLTTPDLKMLQLASPDLEKFIISNYGTNSGMTPTITPLMFTKSAASVTEEQEIYARGFVEALQRLHQQEDDAGVATDLQQQNTTTANVVIQPAIPSCNTALTFSASSAYTAPKSYAQLTTISSEASRNLSLFSGLGFANLTGSMATVSTNTATSSRNALPTTTTVVIPNLSVLKAENPVQAIHAESQSRSLSRPPFVVKSESEQIVPTMMAPINLQQQEKYKNERKRQRNREAAAKCRLRKIHREQELESKVKDLKRRKSDLNDQAVKLRKEVCVLKQKVMEHINGGCTIMLQCQPQGLDLLAQQSMELKAGIATSS